MGIHVAGTTIAVASLALVACSPLVGAPVTPSEEAPDAPSEPDMEVVQPGEARSANLVARPLSLDFASEDTDGTHMLGRWLDTARRRGSRRVGPIALYVVRDGEDGTVECKSVFYPADETVPTEVPGRHEFSGATHPVSAMVTRYEQRCQMVSKPVSRMETTYTMQFDAFSKSMHSVPQMRTVTSYEMRNECHSEPVLRTETHWEYVPEWRYVPPHTEWLTTRRLQETKPVCTEPDGHPVSRVVGTMYLPEVASDSEDSAGESPADSASLSTCTVPHQHLDELARAWAEWYPPRTPRAAPSRVDFLAVCHDLAIKVQACLKLPSARSQRATCGPRLESLPAPLRKRLDDVLLEPAPAEPDEP